MIIHTKDLAGGANQIVGDRIVIYIAEYKVSFYIQLSRLPKWYEIVDLFKNIAITNVIRMIKFMNCQKIKNCSYFIQAEKTQMYNSILIFTPLH